MTASIDIPDIDTDLHCVQDYANKRSLIPACEYVSQCIAAELKRKQISASLFIYVRHALATYSPSTHRDWAGSRRNPLPEEVTSVFDSIFERNRIQGLPSIFRLLDSLAPGETTRMLYLEMRFGKFFNEDGELANVERTTEEWGTLEGFRLEDDEGTSDTKLGWEHCCISMRSMMDLLLNGLAGYVAPTELSAEERKSVEDLLSVKDDPPRIHDYDMARHLRLNAMVIYERLLTQLDGICKVFSLPKSLITYQSLIGAIIRQLRYIKAAIDGLGREHLPLSDGLRSNNYLIRSGDPFGFAIGVSIVTKEAVPTDIISMLEKIHNQIEGRARLLSLTDIDGPAAGSTADALGVEGQPDMDGMTPGEFEEIRTNAFDSLKRIWDFNSRRHDGTVPYRLCLDIAHELVEPAKHRGELESAYGNKPGRRHPYVESVHDDKDNTQPLAASIQQFLSICTDFCDERLEGRDLEFGVLLGNPFLIRYWPGSRPIPLGKKINPVSLGDDRFVWMTTEEIAEQVHVAEGASERCIVVPYDDFRWADPGDDRIPAFSLDLAELWEDLVGGWEDWPIWSPSAATYAYFSYRYPCVVSAMVGPGSSIRVFVGGRLTAIRDGKGWYHHRTLTELIRERIWAEKELRDTDADRHQPLMGDAGLPNGDTNGRDVREDSFESSLTTGLRRLSLVLKVAIQMSPFVRPGHHGGIILYETDANHDFQNPAAPANEASGPTGSLESSNAVDTDRTPEGRSLSNVSYESLHRESESIRLSGANWITGRKLLRRAPADGPGKSGTPSTARHDYNLDHNVARLILRASALDGAVCLSGDCCKVRRFAVRVNAQKADENQPGGGTKRAAAHAWLKAIGRSPNSFAITVSSDGPIRVYYKGADDHVFESPVRCNT